MGRHPLEYLEGKRFCVVFVKVLDAEQERVQLRCLRGRASLDRGRLSVAAPAGNVFSVPATALGTVMPNDGTALLQDAEYFCLVRVDDHIVLDGAADAGVVY